MLFTRLVAVAQREEDIENIEYIEFFFWADTPANVIFQKRFDEKARQAIIT